MFFFFTSNYADFIFSNTKKKKETPTYFLFLSIKKITEQIIDSIQFYCKKYPIIIHFKPYMQNIHIKKSGRSRKKKKKKTA